MREHKHRIWVLLFITLPQALIAAYLAAGYVSAYHINLLIMLALSVVLNAAFTIPAFLKRTGGEGAKQVYPAISASFAVFVVLAVLLLNDTAFIEGFISPRLFAILGGTLSMLYGAVCLAYFLPGDGQNTVKYVAGLVAVPLVWFLLFNIASGVNLSTAAMILIIAGAYLFIFLLAKTIRLWKKNREKFVPAEKWERRLIPLYAVFSLALPQIGLFVNLVMGYGQGGMVGDFGDPLFFIVPAANGILLLVRPFEDRRLRLLRFFLLSVATAYLLYFFIVFLPYIPIGIIGLLAVVGVLFLAPAGALTMQIIHFAREWPRLVKLWGGTRVLAVFIAGLAVLPVCVLTGFIGDRENLNAAAAYLEQNAEEAEKPVDLYRLDRTLKNIESQFETERDIMGIGLSRNTPFISELYSRMVLDKKVISKENAEKLRKLFFGRPYGNGLRPGIFPEFRDPPEEGLTVNGNEATRVKILEAKCDTRYDAELKVYRTWVHLTLEGLAGFGNDEYVTVFTLPEGACISDYYLDVNGVRKKGILADSRAALLVYQDIVEARRDPGLLRYTGERKLELRVFPFSEGQKRYTGFEVMHSQSSEFLLGGKTIELKTVPAAEEVKLNGAALISPAFKATLPAAPKRPLQYYFIVDCSEGSDIGYALSRIEAYTVKNGILSAKVLFTSYGVQEFDLKDMRKANIPAQCGFNLGLAVKKILANNKDNSVPVILFVTDNAADAVFPENVTLLAKRFPDSGYFYELNYNMLLTPYRLGTNEKGEPAGAPIIEKALNYNGYPVRDDGRSEIVPSGRLPERFVSTGNRYKDALQLELLLLSRPSMGARESLNALRASFETGVLTRQTAFTVLETAEQEKRLLRAQKEILSEDIKLAKAETLDEPPFIICLALVAMLGIFTASKRFILGKKRKSV